MKSPGQNTSSPSSLYAQRRKLPLPLRPEGNRSTSSLLGQSSPPRRSSSPFVPRQNGVSGSDWQRRNVTASGNTSPARSTLSLASTVNLYTTVPVSSDTTTPGKLHPPSPLYYDYTEEFEVEGCNQSDALDPPPQFRIGKTIPEERLDEPPAGEVQSRPTNDVTDFQAAISTLPEIPQASNAEKSDIDVTKFSKQDGKRLSLDYGQDSKRMMSVDSEVEQDKETICLSGLGHGARELSCHVEEAFGLPSSPLFVIDAGKNEKEGEKSEKVEISSAAEEHHESDKEAQSARTSSYSLGSQFPQFPRPPGGEEETQSVGTEGMDSEQVEKETRTYVANHDTRHSVELASERNADAPSLRISKESQCLPPSARMRSRSSGFNSINTGLTELAELIESTRSLKSAPGRTKPQSSQEGPL